MSVLARKRQQASTEFEMNCARLVRLTVQRCDSIPKRYQKLVRPKLMQPTMAAYHAVIMANEGDARTEEGREYRRMLFDRVTRFLIALQKPMAVYWSLFDTKEGGRREWIDLVCKELALIDGAARYGDGEREVPMIRTFELEYSDDRIFVNKMRDLHKYTYSKICAVPLEYKDHLSDQILQFVDDALFCVLRGNDGIPSTRKQYEARDKYFKRAIDNLNGLQRPLYALWNVMLYSENTMDEWAGQINECIKLIQGVRNSDKKRFGRLK